MVSGVASPKFRGGGAKFYRLVQWRTQDSVRGATRVWGLCPQPPQIFRDFTRKTLILAYFFVEKGQRVPPNGFNPPLLALLVDLRYSISIFVCRLVVTENISGEGGRGQLLSLLPPPGYASDYGKWIFQDLGLVAFFLNFPTMQRAFQVR